MKFKYVLAFCLCFGYFQNSSAGVLKPALNHSSTIFENVSHSNEDPDDSDDGITMPLTELPTNNITDTQTSEDDISEIDNLLGEIVSENGAILPTKVLPAKIISALAFKPKLISSKLKPISKNDLFAILGIPKIKKLTTLQQSLATDQKNWTSKIVRTKREDREHSHVKGRETEQVESNFLTVNELDSLFVLARPAEIEIQRCGSPEYTIATKCISNFAQIVITSEKRSTDGIVQIYPTGKHLSVKGFYTTVYLVWHMDNGILNPSLQTNVTVADLTGQQIKSNMLETVLHLWEEGDFGCSAEINCGTESIGQDVKMHHDSGKNRSIVASTISLYGEDHQLLYENDNVERNKSIKIFVKALVGSSDIEIFVDSCNLLQLGQHPIPLLKEGCSVSKSFKNFEREPWLGHLRRDAKSLSSCLTTYNISQTANSIQIGCKIFVCRGSCGIENSCQKLRPSKKSQVLQYSYLQAGFHQRRHYEDGDQHDHSKTINTPREDDCVGKRFCLSLVMMLSLVYFILLYLCLSYAKHYTTASVRRAYTEEVESPHRPIFSEYSITRKRSPPTKYFY